MAELDTPSHLPSSTSKTVLVGRNGDSPLSEQLPPNATSVTSVSEFSDRFADADKLCGWGNFRPFCLQNFRTPQWILFWLCWAGALQGLIVNGFINVIITTIEKRYELKSTETGLIAGCYDIASFLCLIPVTYFGGTRSKPFFLGTGLVILACGSLVFSLPYFLAGPYTFSQEQDFHCHSGIQNFNYSVACSSQESSLSNYKYVFFVAQFLHGAGAVPLYTLGCTYLDENVPTMMSSMYLGVFYTMAVVGPAMGYVLGGQLLKIYVDYGVDANELGLSPASTVWVGAWWVGFVIAAVFGFLIAIPLLAFPKNLPSTEKVKAGKVSEMHQKLEESAAVQLNFGASLSDLPASLKLLVTNPTFVFLSLAGASEGILLAGLATFLPKLIESQFSYQASFAAFVVGTVSIPGAGGGNLLGGYVVKRFKMKCGNIIRMCMFFCLVCLAFSFIFVLHCPDANFVGVNSRLDNLTNESRFSMDCNSDCLCSDQNYDPVCGIDNSIYFSPCYAGCQQVYQEQEKKAFGSCSCIKSEGIDMTFHGTTQSVQATREKCSNNCSHGFLFLLIIFFCMFFTFIVSMPSLSATLRCVAETQKSFGLGIQWMTVRLLGTFPAPIFFGWLIDKSCILWQDSCDSTVGSCLFYNNEKMSKNILSIVCLVKLFSFTFFSLAWYTYRAPESVSYIESRENVSQIFTKRKKSQHEEDSSCLGIRFSSYHNEAFSSLEGSNKSYECVSPLPEDTNGTSLLPRINKYSRKYEYITYEKAVENIQRSTDTHLNEKLFLDPNDLTIQQYIDSISKEIEPYMTGPFQVLKVRGRKDKSFTAWILLDSDACKLEINENFLRGVTVGELNISAITLVEPNEERCLRISVAENGVRLYEIIKGSFEFEFIWWVGNRKCNTSLSINHCGIVTYSDQNFDLNLIGKNKNVQIRLGDMGSKQMSLSELIFINKNFGTSQDV